MAYKDILVHIDSTPQCAARIDIAVYLAQQHQAHLTGLNVISHPFHRPQYERATLDAAELQAYFERSAAQAGISAEWLCVDWPEPGVSVSDIVNLHAYLKDLVIIGQADSGKTGDGILSDLPERVVWGSGRPVLIVPSAGSFKTVGERVMVGWKYGRESVRALHDAMPFLLKARQVRVVTVNPPEATAGADKKLFADISTHLAHHGITPKVDQLTAADISIGDMLLNESWEEGCDLLVMGVYAHATHGAITVGSVASHLLKHMTLPVLTAH